MPNSETTSPILAERYAGLAEKLQMPAMDPKIFNLDKQDYGVRQSLFMGEDPGLVDTVNMSHPALRTLFREQKVLDWDENEVPFESCNAEFKSRPPIIAGRMIDTLAWQWEADSIAARTIYAVMAPFITNSELSRVWCKVTEVECVTGDHEVLTPTGWKRIDLVTMDDKVAQWDYDTRAITFVNPTAVIAKQHAGKMYRFHNSVNNVSQITTPNHRMPIVYPYTYDRAVKDLPAETVAYHGANAIPTAGYIQSGERRLTPLERLFIAVQADGSLASTKYNGARVGTIPYRFSFQKQRKIDRLHKLCEEGGWEIVELHTAKAARGGCRTFHVHVPVEDYRWDVKSFDWFKLDEITYEWAIEFLDEIKYWDGNITSDYGRVRYISSNKSCIDKVVSLAHLVGKRGHVTVIPERFGVVMPDGNIIDTKEAYQVHLTNRTYNVGNAITKDEFDYDGMVYCLSVPSTYFLVRHGNSVTVTGNCLHAATYSEIVRCSFDNPKAVLDSVLQNVEAMQRMSVIGKAFSDVYRVSHELALGMRKREDAETYDAAMMATVALLALERIQFMASFAITFANANQGMFVPIGKSVQRICQDEYEIHVQLDKYVLNWELSLPCGKAFLERNRDRVKALFDDVIACEFRWIDYMDFASQPMVGLTDGMLRDWVIYCAADAMAVLGMKPDHPVPRQSPIPFMDRWIDVSKIQSSPQEEKGRTQYKTNMLRDNLGDRILKVDF